MTRIITITGGTGGVGKTCVAVSLAAQLALRGQRVCLLDADGGTGSAAQLLDVTPCYTLGDLLQTGITLDDVLIRNCQGFDLVPGDPDPGEPLALTDTRLQGLAGILSQLDGYDCILIDAAFGGRHGAHAFALAGSEIILLVTPEPAILSDSYALLRQLHDGHAVTRVCLVVNKAVNQSIGEQTYTKFKEVAGFYLGQDVPLLGVLGVSEDRQDTAQLADRLVAEGGPACGPGLQDFGQRLLRASGLSLVAGRQMAPDSATPPDEDAVQCQLEGLTRRVGELITEVETLRAAAGRKPGVIDFLRTGREIPASRRAEVCFAVQITSEDVAVQGDTVSIYHMQRSNGDTQRFACHSLDDDIQEPEPQSTSS